MIWILCIVTLLFSSCEQKLQESHYKEIVINAPQASQPSVPTAQPILNWVSPDGWKQEPGKHMRMASFHSITDPNAIDCYIIAIAGPAGGLEANLERWLDQLGIQASEDNVKKLTSSAQILKTKDGLEIRVFDFTSLQTQGSSSDKSMIAAMLPAGQTTVFVKMTGTMGTVKENKDNFLKLLGSIIRK